MPKISYNPDASHAYNFEPDDQAIIGFVKSFKIGTQSLATDITLKPPTGSSATPTSYCGVIEKIDWDGGASDTMTFHFRVSGANHHTIVNLSHSATTDIVVETVFTVYEYDTAALEYFEAFKTDASGIKGEIKLTTNGQALSVNRPGAGEGVPVPGVNDWYVSLLIEPYVGVSQVLHFATAKNKALTKKWGKPAETGTGSGTSDSSPSTPSLPASVSEPSGASREAVEALERKLEAMHKWLVALSEKVDLKFEQAHGQYTVKTTPVALSPEKLSKLRAADKTINESRNELR